MTPVVHLSKGASLVGKQVAARGSSVPVCAFLGVPYAKPPVGDLRFQRPQPLPLWVGEKKATEFGPICPQNVELVAQTYRPFPVPDNMNEDCLYLNVWTPSLDTSSQLPVMFWIYGGAFTQGFSDYYDGTAFAGLHNVVFVSFNYRVGPFGFLCTGDEVAPGNVGLLDQIEALKWVRRYIQYFGGDPNNITIFGESAGAISASMHLCSPLAKGLFRRVICQSGVAWHPGNVWPRSNARKYILKRVQAMGCLETDSRKIIQFMERYSSEELVQRMGYGFQPVHDYYYMTELPEHFMKQQKYPVVELLLGFNSHEGAQFTFELARSKTVSNAEQALQLVEYIITKMFFRGSPAGADITKAVINEYLSNVDEMTEEDLTLAVSDLYGDVLFVAATVLTANIHSERCQTYMYRFSYRPSLSRKPHWVEADHGQEVPLVIGEPVLGRFPGSWSTSDSHVSRTLMTYWSNFARTGNPNGPDQSEWPQYSKAEQKYLEIKEKPYVACTYQPKRMSFWHNVVPDIITRSTTPSKY